ncbi:MAG: nucleoid occlusion protein [Defluviitaleaceae bacterium]|nr:nucleoid occlusion protein [Defluviitaleaceae bacterium]
MEVLVKENEITYLQIDLISPNPYQPRKFFDKESIEELSKSIMEYGVLQPISVRLINGQSYELVAGERRLRASRLAGIEKIPAIIVNIKDRDSAIVAIIENIQRENLNYIEEAIGYNNLLLDYKFTQEELATRLGKSQSTIANKIRLLKLSKNVQKILIENGLSERHARALIRLDNEELQLTALKKIISLELNVKKTEELVEKYLTEKKEAKREPKVKRIIKDIRLFSNSILQSINTMKESGYDTEYLIDQIDGGYEILIKVSYPNMEEVK